MLHPRVPSSLPAAWRVPRIHHLHAWGEAGGRRGVCAPHSVPIHHYREPRPRGIGWPTCQALVTWRACRLVVLGVGSRGVIAWPVPTLGHRADRLRLNEGAPTCGTRVVTARRTGVVLCAPTGQPAVLVPDHVTPLPGRFCLKSPCM